MIRAGVGLSTAQESTRAAIEAARSAMEGLGGARPDWCIAFPTSEHGTSLKPLLEALSEATGTPYVVGCSVSGVLAADREVEHGPGLGVLAVASDQLRGTPFLFQDGGDHGMTAGVQLGQRLLGSRGTGDLIVVWPDPFHVRPDLLLQALEATLGDIPVVGGAASSRGASTGTFEFCGDESSRQAVSGLRLSGSFRHTVAVTQGCRPLGDPLRVTRSHENLILELEGRPPLEVLMERMPRALLEDPRKAFHFLFVGLLPDPMEPVLRPGEYLVRNIVASDPDTGVLAIGDTVEEGQYVLFALREGIAARQDLTRILEQVSPEQTGMEYRFGLYFNCLARGSSLYRQTGVDSKLIRDALPNVPILGFFCNAEIGPLRGVNRLFTYTGVLVLVAD